MPASAAIPKRIAEPHSGKFDRISFDLTDGKTIWIHRSVRRVTAVWERGWLFQLGNLVISAGEKGKPPKGVAGIVTGFNLSLVDENDTKHFLVWWQGDRGPVAVSFGDLYLAEM